jgi:hypothetical protein
LAVGRRHHDLFDEPFALPTVFDEVTCEPIEQLWMRRVLRARAEIVETGDDPLAK